jgi:hypothetical protein
MQIQNEFETNLREVPAASKALSLAALHDLKPKTWYYGLRCACERLLALCEDCFEGRGDELVLYVPVVLAAECGCGAVTRAQVLYKFRTT